MKEITLEQYNCVQNTLHFQYRKVDSVTLESQTSLLIQIVG